MGGEPSGCQCILRIETIGPGNDVAHARTPDEEDRRQLIVTLTERGRSAAETQAAAQAEVDAALAASARPTLRRHAGLRALIDIGAGHREAH